jgi:serine/threonine protein kinase, bacterial
MAIRTLGSRYLLEERIGQGGMGVVWRGRDKVIGTAFAIKVLRSEYAADSDAVTRFVRERTVLMKFRHPAVVSVHDMIVEGDQLALVMDLVDGGDLYGYRQRNGGTLPCGEAARIGAQICDGLDAAHQAGIIHRDLKPANVLLSDGGLLSGGQVRLADFGVARIVGDKSATTTGTVLGTAAYLAPELLTGSQPSEACDMYALGITLYEVLAGQPPFTGHVAAIMHDHLEKAPARIPGVPDLLWDLVSSCLAKKPEARPTAAAMSSSLRDPELVSALAPAGMAVASASTAVAPVSTAVAPGGMAVAPGGMAVAPGGMAVAPGGVAAAGPLAARPPQRGPVAPAMGWQGPGAGSGPGAGPGPWQQPRRPAAQQPVSPASARPTGPGGQYFVPAGAPAAAPFARPPGGGNQDGDNRNGDGHDGGNRGGRNKIIPATIGAVVVVLLALTAVAGIAHLGPFHSGHKALASTGRSASPAGGAADPTPGTSRTAGLSAPSSRPSSSRRPGPGHSAHASATPTGIAPSGAPKPSRSGKPAPSSAVSYGPNLVVNGDFAADTLGIWTAYGAQVVLGAGPGGQNAARLVAAPSAGLFQQITGLTPGASYLVTGWAQTSESTIQIGAGDPDYTHEVAFFFSSSSWVKGSVVFTLGPAQTTANVFCVQGKGGTGACTDITFEEIRHS